MILGITVSEVHAQTTYFRDTFDTNGALLGLSPNVGGNWTITGTSVVNPLTVSSNALGIASTGQDAYGALTSAVPLTAGNHLYTGVDINVSAAQATGDYFLHLSDPAGTTTNFYQRVFVRSATGGFQIGLASNSGTGTVTTYGTTVLNLNQTYRVVVSWDFVAGAANDVFNVYVDPTNPIQSNNTAYISNYTWTGSAEPAATISAVNFRQGTNTSAPTLTADRLVVTDDFGTVIFTPVPEPTTIVGLTAFGAFAIGGIRRRFKKKA